MRLRLPLIAAAATAAVAASASAQLSSVVGPDVAPIGCPVSISISNDSAASTFTGPCPYQVRNAHGIPIFSPICPLLALPLDPGKTFSTTWDQIDDNFVQVPARTYTIDVFLVGAPIQHHTIMVGGAVSGVAPLGVPKIGTTRHYALCSKSDPGGFYVMLASGSSLVGIPTCGGTIPLDPDAILTASLSDPTVFVSTAGNLDAAGMSSAPALAIPSLPSLVGVNVNLAMLVLDLVGACPFKSISAPMHIQIS